MEIDVYSIIAEMESQIREDMGNQQLSRFNPEKTAITRKGPSNPVKIVFQMKKIQFQGKVVLDYGKGKSNDCQFVTKNGGRCYIYDFTHCPLLQESEPDGQQLIRRISRQSPKEPFDIIILSFVLNVVTKMERKIIANTVLRLLKPNGVIIVGVREDITEVKANWRKFEDGFITTIGTFQSFFYPYELGLRKLQELFPTMQISRIGLQTWLITYIE